MVCETGWIRGFVVSDNTESLLRLEGVNLAIHGKPILNDVSFELKAGQTLGIIGESGSGKSMTALAIMQLLPRGSTVSGSIHFAGHALHELAESALCELRGSDIGMVFQEPMTALNPVKTIGDQVSESVRLHRRVSRREADLITLKTLERVGLPNEQFPLSRYPHELSGGQRQRVVIAIAVACKPRLLIADEPTTALDVTTQAGILALLKELQAQEQLGLILITHDLAVVSSMADDIVVMNKGGVVEQGELLQVFKAPADDYTRMLFAASALTQVKRKPIIRDANANANANANINTQADIVHPLLSVSDLVCEYVLPRKRLFSSPGSFRAIDKVSFEVHAGESMGLVGESGCGKSTLTRALLGLMSLHSGTITLAGESVTAMRQVSSSARQLMQVVFQDPYGSFNPRHKVGRLVSEPLHVLDYKPGRAEVLRRVTDVLSSVGMRPDDCDKYIHEFSGGQRQRIAIARSLIVGPKIVILDEAVSALDVSVRAQVLELLDTLAEEQGLAYLFISHDLSVVQRVTDRVMVMRDGQIVERGYTADVFADPQHAYTQALISAAPVLNLD